MALNLQTETVFTGDTSGTPPPLPPDQIAPYFPQLEILECLGRGGMGVVYKARQKTLNRWVALKLLAPERVQDAKFAERFTREAQALAALNHPNIVTIHDFGQAGGYYFLLMEFVDGMNLRQLLRTQKLTPEAALAIVPPLCDALQFAHDRGVIHRDIKPENLLLDKSGRIKIADFGIAKILGSDPTTTPPLPADAQAASQPASGATAHTGDHIVGTPQYSAPEQKNDPQRVDNRADIYSLGVVFYEMLTGELPGKRLEPPSRKVQIDVRLDDIVLRALEQKPELRYQQVSEVKTLVETLAAGNSKPAAGSPQPLGAMKGSGYLKNFEFKSTQTWLGLPLLHMTSGFDPVTGQIRVARGVVAIGRKARGIIAIGGSATGILAIGGMAMGVFAIGGCALGLISFGGLAIALLFGLGGVALAPIAVGGQALGYLVYAGIGFGKHVVDGRYSDPDTYCLFSTFFPWIRMQGNNIQLNTLALVTLGLLGIILPIANDLSPWFRHRIADPSSKNKQPNNIKSHWPQRFKRRLIKMLYRDIPIVLVLILIIRTFFLQPVFITTNETVPDFPTDSVVWIWKLASHFEPGDLVAWRLDKQIELGRIARCEKNKLIVVISKGRYSLPIRREMVVGKVVSIYWHGAYLKTSITQTNLNFTSTSNMSPLVANLKNCKVELLAVGNQPWSNPFCWLPNGTPSSKPFQTKNFTLGDAIPLDQAHKKMIFQVSNCGTNRFSLPNFQFGKEVLGSLSGALLSEGFFGTNLIVLAIDCSTNAKAINFRLKFAPGLWKECFTLTNINQYSRFGAQHFVDRVNDIHPWIVNSSLVERGGMVAIQFRYPLSEDWETRMVALTDSEQVLQVNSVAPSGGALKSIGGVLLVTTNEFSHLKEFQLQRRKYDLIEFRNISLEPGYQTKAEVVDLTRWQRSSSGGMPGGMP